MEKYKQNRCWTNNINSLQFSKADVFCKLQNVTAMKSQMKYTIMKVRKRKLIKSIFYIYIK